MTDRTELLAAILADPACDVKRLAYADLLEDSGEVERAEWMRRQVAHEPPASPPPLTMLAETEAFLGAGLNSAVEYRRGFISDLRGPLASLLEHGPAIVAVNPVERVEALDHKPIYVTEATGSCWVADYGLTIVRHITEDGCRDALNASVLAELRRRAGVADTMTSCRSTTSEHGPNHDD